MRKIKKLIKKFIYISKQRSIQDSYDISDLINAKKISVFFIPEKENIGGGTMSIFNFCSFSREVDSSILSIISTLPSFSTYSKNNNFKNNEKIYRISQIINYAKNIEELYLHIPEFCCNNFYKNLKKKEIKKLKSIPKVKINILNQNIDFMQSFDNFKSLFNITGDISHSVGFNRYKSQPVCNRYKLPLFYIKSYIDLECKILKNFKEKEKKILYSSDYHPMKKRILLMIQKKLPDYKLVCIENLKYEDFLELIANSAFCLSFGEGFDGYFIQPYYAGSIGITVYNEKFFPSKIFKEMPFVYKSYSDLYHRVVEDIKLVFNNEAMFNEINKNTLEILKQNIELAVKTKEGLKNFYNNKPDLLPTEDNFLSIYSDSENILTVIIFTYNHKNSISDCIEGIVNQNTKYKYKIDIWDDASIDETSEICLEYAKKYPDKIDLIIQDKNTFLKSYQKIQSLHAIKKINTKYFCIIDGDDMWLDDNKIELAIDFLENNVQYIGFGHDAMERNLFTNKSASYFKDLLKIEITNPINLSNNPPFILTSSRIFRNIGYANLNILPIDYLLYYYHLSYGPIYYYDKIMGLYNIGDSSNFASFSSKKINDKNCFFPAKLSKVFNYKQDEFCTNLLKSIVKQHYKRMFRYNLLILLKKIFGVKMAWIIWFDILFTCKYGIKSRNVNFVYKHKDAKNKSDYLTKNKNLNL
jgi:glycosyltransferase involved in cell wall biosynthesis